MDQAPEGGGRRGEEAMSDPVETLKEAIDALDAFLLKREHLRLTGEYNAEHIAEFVEVTRKRKEAFDALDASYRALWDLYTEVAYLVGYAYAADGMRLEPGPADIVLGEVERLLKVESEWNDLHAPFPRDEWHADDGDVLWWRFPVTEPPYVGSPLDGDDFPDYVTHWTRCPVPTMPVLED